MRQGEPAAEAIHITNAEISRIGSNRVAIVTVVYVDPPTELVVSGSAIVRRDRDDAVARALLDATNRRLARAERRPYTRLIRHRAVIRANLGRCHRSPSSSRIRLGGADGVAVEARKWEWALQELGFSVRRVAGELDDDRRADDVALPFLAIDPPEGTSPAPIRAGDRARRRRPRGRREPLLAPDQPRRVGAGGHRARPRTTVGSCSTTTTCRGNAPVCRRLPTCRRTDANSLHVTINDHSRVQLENRGFDAITLRNAFDLDPVRGDRERTRVEFGFAPDDVVLLQPTRAIPRKNIPAAIEFAAELAASGTRS